MTFPLPREAEGKRQDRPRENPHQASRKEDEGHGFIGLVLHVVEALTEGEQVVKRRGVMLVVIPVRHQSLGDAPGAVEMLKLVGIEVPRLEDGELPAIDDADQRQGDQHQRQDGAARPEPSAATEEGVRGEAWGFERWFSHEAALAFAPGKPQ